MSRSQETAVHPGAEQSALEPRQGEIHSTTATPVLKSMGAESSAKSVLVPRQGENSTGQMQPQCHVSGHNSIYASELCLLTLRLHLPQGVQDSSAMDPEKKGFLRSSAHCRLPASLCMSLEPRGSCSLKASGEGSMQGMLQFIFKVAALCQGIQDGVSERKPPDKREETTLQGGPSWKGKGINAGIRAARQKDLWK